MMGWIENNLAAIRIRFFRKRAFQRALDTEGPNGEAVERFLAWMRDYCFAQKSTAGATPEETARNNGRREVWLAINDVLNFDEQEVRKFVETHEEFLNND